MVNEELLQALGIVEAHPDYRVMRRFTPQRVYTPRGDRALYRAAMIDLETTSADTETAEVIEFAGVRFTFDANGVIYDIEDEYTGLSQPSQPLEPIITEITGLTDADLHGQMISLTRLDELLAGVDLVIAYNADFDRRIAERNFPGRFEKAKWACAFRQVPWVKYGAITGKLENVMVAAGLFYDAHRALVDCQASVHLLATMTRQEEVMEPGETVDAMKWRTDTIIAMQDLLSTTKKGAVRVLAHGSSFGVKDRLKARGYQWRGKVPWFVDKPTMDEAEIEMQYLRDNNLSSGPAVVMISSRHRYSKREDVLTFQRDD